MTTAPSRRLIHLMIVGEASCYSDHTLPGIVRFAQKCEARVHITTQHRPTIDVKSHPQWGRLDVLSQALQDPTWDQLLVMDTDIHVHHESPDIFSQYPKGFHVCEDLFIKTTPSYGKFQDWLSCLGLGGPCLNGGVILTDRPSLEKISPWLNMRPFVGPFDASDQNHENLAIKHTFPDLVPMDIRWNTPDPHSTHVDHGQPVIFHDAYFRHSLEVRGWKAKDAELGRIAMGLRPTVESLLLTMTSIYCLPRVVRLCGLKVGHLSTRVPVYDALRRITDAKLVGEEYLDICDFALLADDSRLGDLPDGSLAILPLCYAQSQSTILRDFFPISIHTISRGVKNV